MSDVFDAERKNELEKEIKRLRQWVADLQSGMYVNCVYCGHRYGPQGEVPESQADILKAHIEVCPEHPMSALKKSNATLRRMLEGRARYHQKVEEHLRKISAAALPVYDDAMSERIWVGMDDSLRRDDEGPLPTPAQVDATLVEARKRELADADALAASFVKQFPSEMPFIYAVLEAAWKISNATPFVQVGNHCYAVDRDLVNALLLAVDAYHTRTPVKKVPQ